MRNLLRGILLLTLLLSLSPGLQARMVLPEETPTLERLRKWASAGDIRSQHDLAVLHLEGRGLKQDYEMARRMFEKAASGGDALSMFSLGEMYTRGIGVTPDYEQATIWFTRAAETGANLSDFRLKTLYYSNLVLPERIEPQPAPPRQPPAPTPVPAREEKPAEPPRAQAPLRQEEVRDFVKSWAAAWSSRDPEAYLSLYSPAFVPRDRVPRENWEALRKSRILNPSWIRVELEDVRIRPLEHGWVRVDFRQSYRSPLYSDRVRKTLMLRKEQGGWRILAERATALPSSTSNGG